MKSPQDWLSAQIADRPDDFAPDEMAMPLSWIASVQADARKDLVAALRDLVALEPDNSDEFTGEAEKYERARALIEHEPA